MHGDLHAGNIVARQGEAILIDFHACRRRGPVLADPALLEISLVFHPDTVAAIGDDRWTDLVAGLYQQDRLGKVPPPTHARDLGGPWWSAVRQIRLHALTSEVQPGEYAEVLAMLLFRHAMKDRTAAEEDVVRGAAYATAERLAGFTWP